MKSQTITLKQKNILPSLIKMTPRKLLILSDSCEFEKDKKKLINVSHDLQKKYGVEDFFIKVVKNKLKIIPLD